MSLKIKLANEIDGKKELVLDMESLTGMDLLRAEKESRARGTKDVMLEFSNQYCAQVAAIAAGVKVEDIELLPAKDFATVVMYVKNFLLGSLA